MRSLMMMNTFPPFYTGGAEVVAYHEARGLRARGVEVSALVLNNRRPSAVDEWFTLDGIPIHRIHTPPVRRTHWRDAYDPRMYRHALAEIRRLKPDVVHLHNMSAVSLAPYVACRVAGIPVVNTLHDYWLLCTNNMLFDVNEKICSGATGPACGSCWRVYDHWADIPGRRLVFRTLTSNVKRFTSPSQKLIDLHVTAGYARSRFVLIPSGLDERVTEPKHPVVRQLIASAPRHNNVIYAGGGVAPKGVATLIEALPVLRERIPDLRVVVVGGGERHFAAQLAQYEPMVVRLERVPFGEMRGLFAAMDLTLSPSLWHDNSPTVIYESLQMGTPVAGAAVGGIPELIKEGETGYLFPVGDAATLTERVAAHFQRTPLERRQMRQRCVADARERLSLDLHVARMIDTYRDVIGGR